MVPPPSTPYHIGRNSEAAQARPGAVLRARENAQAMADRFILGSSPRASASIARCEVRDVAATA
jgi:hypothetical protein